jgi:hypothetical protein
MVHSTPKHVGNYVKPDVIFLVYELVQITQIKSIFQFLPNLRYTRRCNTFLLRYIALHAQAYSPLNASCSQFLFPQHFNNMSDILHPQTGTNFKEGSEASSGSMNVCLPAASRIPNVWSLFAQTVILTNHARSHTHA